MSKQFIQINEKTMAQLEKMAKQKGYPSVEKLLTAVANGFSTGCSVTCLKNTHRAA